MSTARIAPPEGGLSVFDHDPELWGTFNRFYGYLWTYGALDQPTKEAARLRNARVTGCPVCRNLRFDGAREQGLTEDYVEQIVDGYEKSDLPDRWKDAVRWTDAVIGYPASVTGEERGGDRHRLHARGVRGAHAHRGDRAGLLEVGRRVGRRERHAHHHRAHADARQRGDRRAPDARTTSPTSRRRMSRPVRIAGQQPDDWSESTRAEFADVDEASRHRLHLPSVIANHPTFLPPYMTWAKAVALSGVLDRRDNALLALRTGLPLRFRVRVGSARRDRACCAAGP